MITRMTVDNFKALRHVQVDLAPFTVLIGPNDSGKTSFLEAVFALAETTRSHLGNYFWSPWQNRELVYKQNADIQVRFAADLANCQAESNGRPNPEDRLSYSLALTFGSGHSCTVFEERIGFVGKK
jgi:recombinational DNA repair ATPase RecF